MIQLDLPQTLLGISPQLLEGSANAQFGKTQFFWDTLYVHRPRFKKGLPFLTTIGQKMNALWSYTSTCVTLLDFNSAITKNKNHLLPSFLPNKVNCWPVRKRLDNDKIIRISTTIINISISNYNSSSCLSWRFCHQLSKTIWNWRSACWERRCWGRWRWRRGWRRWEPSHRCQIWSGIGKYWLPQKSSSASKYRVVVIMLTNLLSPCAPLTLLYISITLAIAFKYM